MRHLFKQFSDGFTWNALLYALYKASTTLLSLVLFMRLTSYDYATWANINALVFLSILWLDFGLRKSIPRFCPEFARNPTTHRSFIRTILRAQSFILILSAPLFIYIATTTAHTLSLEHNLWLFYSATLLFLTEGLIAVVRILYHAHFWNKEFNTISIAILTIEMLCNAILIYRYTTSTQILTALFVIKIITSCAMIVACLVLLPYMYRLQRYNESYSSSVDIHKLKKSFIKHSAIMWFNTNIKSLSERNFLVPFITYSLGHVQANMFKVANDGALLVYRMIIKTIGSNDTALLAHVHVLDNNNTKAMEYAFTKLTTKIAGLCLPLLGILSIGWVISSHFHNNQDVFLIFFIITIGYLIEALLSPYERLLEVYAHYRLLIYAYIPYILMIIFLYYFNCITFIGLVTMILIVQGVRLVSSLCMVYYAHRTHNMTLSISASISAFYHGMWYTVITIAITIPLSIGGYYCMRYMGVDVWVAEWFAYIRG